MVNTAEVNSKGTPTSSSKVKYLLIAAAIIGLVLLARYFHVQDILKSTLDRIENLGMVGIVVFAIVYIVACVFLIPASVLTLGAGAIYGLTKGFILVSLASTAGACAAFVVGRYVAREWVSTKIAGNEKFKAIDEAVALQGWKIVFLTRLTPALPFNLQNYAYGLTKVSLPQYALASWVGMMPGTLLFTYIGTLGGAAAEADTSAAKWAVNIVALVATVAVTAMITRIARNALKQNVEPDASARIN